MELKDTGNESIPSNNEIIKNFLFPVQIKTKTNDRNNPNHHIPQKKLVRTKINKMTEKNDLIETLSVLINNFQTP